MCGMISMAFLCGIVYSLGMENNEIFHRELNFRDLGGYPVYGGRKVRCGMFYRSAGLYGLKKNEMEKFRQLGIRAVLDLRTRQECERRPDPVFSGIIMIRHSGLVSAGGEDIDFSITGMNKIGEDARTQMEKLVYYYGEMPFHNEALRVMFDHILDGDVPLLFHCASGKDRTGVAAIVLLLALGADPEDAFRDYMKSAENRREHLQRTLSRSRERILEHPELEELLTMKESVTERIGRLILSRIAERYSSVPEYLEKEYGLDAERRSLLREIGTENCL